MPLPTLLLLENAAALARDIMKKVVDFAPPIVLKQAGWLAGVYNLAAEGRSSELRPDDAAQ